MILAVDTETTGTDFFHGCRPFLITACDGSSNYYWWGDVNPYTREVFWKDDDLEEVTELLDKATKLVFHNTQFDMRALASIDLPTDRWWDKVEDTVVASHALCSGDTHALKDLAIKYLQYWDDDEYELDEIVKSRRQAAGAQGYAIARAGHPHFPALRKTGTKWHKMDFWLAPEECLKYGLKDAERTWLLWKAFKPALVGESLWEAYRKRIRLLKVCYDITSEGMDVKLEEAQTYINDSLKAMEDMRQEIKALAGIRYKFAPTKADHLIDLLHNRMGIPVAYRTPGDSPATHQEALKFYEKTYDYPAIQVLARRRKLETKVRYTKSYIDWADDQGKIHSSLNLTGTRETRQSSSDPNQQNVTRELEQFFGPRPGWVWMNADYANIEARIWAYSVGNADLIEKFEKGISLHMIVFEALFPAEAATYAMMEEDEKNPEYIRLARIYRNIKAFNFGLIYGATEMTADKAVGKPGSYRSLIGTFPEIRQYTQSLTSELFLNCEKDYRPYITTAGGYKLDVPLDEPFKVCNYFVQGTAGEITGEAMWDMYIDDDYNDSGSRMIAQVHDSLKIKIPLCRETEYLANHFAEVMANAGKKFIPSCDVDYKIKYNEADEDSPHLQFVRPPF
jgi:DNA polymerase I-like protein with 3'-5' exonuclease and polymerase domains